MLYCFDIDGTLIRSFMESGEADAYDRIDVLQGRRERIARLALQPGARFALVTNQAGVAFGYQDRAQVERKVALVTAEFSFFHGRPFSVHVAFHHPKASVDAYKCIKGDEEFCRRKPEPGMLVEAMQRHRTDTATTWFVGDMPSDEQAARSAGVKYFDAEEFFG